MRAEFFELKRDEKGTFHINLSAVTHVETRRLGSRNVVTFYISGTSDINHLLDIDLDDARLRALLERLGQR
jgi:hypothetical protein